MIDISKKYRRLFNVQGLRFLIDDIWMGYYKELSALTVYIDGFYTSYLPEDVVEECLTKGVELYSNKGKFEDYRNNFLEFKKRVLELCEKIAREGDISKEELAKSFQLFSELFEYYSKTEFFYTDKVFLKLRENSSLHKEIGELKYSGRELLNKIFFGKGGYLNIFLKMLSDKFNITVEELCQYGVQEILELYDGKKVSPKVITERNIAFIIVGDDDLGVNVVYGEEAKELIVAFQEGGLLQELKGTIANAGKVRGEVKLIVSGYDNFDDLQGQIDEMHHGAILVSETTSPELTLACHKAAAIVTNQGGMLSHAAVISRELGIPCIVGTGNATEVLKDGDVVEVDAELGVVRKIEKDNSSYAFVWSNYQPLYSLEMNINGLVNFRDIVWNRTNNIIQVMKNNTISCFHSAQDLEDDAEKGKLFLDQDFREKFVSDVELACKKHKEFFSEVKNLDFSQLSNEEVISWFAKATYLWSSIMSYFRASQANPTKQIIEDLKRYFPEEAEMLITFPELDDANKELVDWQNLLKEEYSSQKVLAHAEKYPWIVAVHFTKEDVLDTLTQKYNHDKHNFGFKDVIKEKEEVKEKQRRIIGKITKNKNLQDLVLFLQKLTWSRMEIKSCWAGTDFYMIPLIKEISQRTGESVHDINLYYLIDEIKELLLSGRRLSREEKENRKKCFVGLWKDRKTVYLSGQDAEKLAQKELGELYSVPKTNEIKGTVASQGKKIGRARLLESNNITQLREMRRLFQVGDILITQMTQPNIIDIAGKAGAIVTDEGGMLSHAAIIAREFGVPCIVGTNVATKVLKDGDLVEVDAEKGIVRKIE